MSRNRIILIAAALFTLALMLFFSKQLISPYLPFAEARKTDRPIQIIGIPDRNLPPSIDPSDCLILELSDYHNHDESMLIQYCNSIPENITHAESIVAHGRYIKESKIFKAERLYYKCPSKYKQMKKQ